MSTVDLPAGTLTERARQIAADIAGPLADEVDASARFPSEAIAALRAAGLLGALVPVHLGGAGASTSETADAVAALARGCASTAMVYAMHQIQVACLARHGGTPKIDAFLADVAAEGLLLASATTEAGVGGDVRTSICAVTREDGHFRLEKEAPVISYGAFADAVLATARRSADSPASDQVLVVCRRGNTKLEETSGWDTLGFRGTCSNGFRLTAEDDEDYVLPASYADISAQTMLPTSHIVWSSVWLGIAGDAVDRARRYVQAEARRKPGQTTPAALHLAELMPTYQSFVDLVHGAARRYDELAEDRDALSSVGFAVAINGLKVAASELVVDIVHRALLICGMAGYRNDSPFSLGRHLRDALGAALMVNNDRIVANNAQLLLVHRGET